MNVQALLLLSSRPTLYLARRLRTRLVDQGAVAYL